MYGTVCTLVQYVRHTDSIRRAFLQQRNGLTTYCGWMDGCTYWDDSSLIGCWRFVLLSILFMLSFCYFCWDPTRIHSDVGWWNQLASDPNKQIG
jgi:hypothetical protein